MLATLARAVGEFSQVTGVVALVNHQATVIETGQVVPITAPDQVVVAGTTVMVPGGGQTEVAGLVVRVDQITDAQVVVRISTS